MRGNHTPQPERSQPVVYQIRVKGHLDSRWTDWFEGLAITLEEGDTLLTGPVVDQAALHGLLKKVRDLGMPLVSVNSVEPGAEEVRKIYPQPIFPIQKQSHSEQVIRLHSTQEIHMKSLQKFGGFAALYLAAAYLVGMVIFLAVLDSPSITDPAQRVALLVRIQMVTFSTNLLMYVFFGVFLIVLSLALYDRLKSGAPAIMLVATVIGIIWAGSLIASGMVSNAGIAPVVALYAKDPSQAALTWQGIETVASGLGNGNGEILGGLFTLLVSLAALRAGGLPRGLNFLGLVVGAVGILSILPGLISLAGVFGLSQIIWFVWLGIVLLRSDPGKMA
jgi:hypothetical protein